MSLIDDETSGVRHEDIVVDFRLIRLSRFPTRGGEPLRHSAAACGGNRLFNRATEKTRRPR